MQQSIQVTPLGQVGFRLGFPDLVIYIDPYLSNSVQDQEAQDLRRLQPIAVAPESVVDADFVFITHEHRDHCDPDTLTPLAAASPDCVFVSPPSARPILISIGISEKRIRSCPREGKLSLGSGVLASTTPAAHPRVKLDGQGEWVHVGYIFEWSGVRLYHAGDTAVSNELIEYLSSVGKIHFAFLPVNEINFFRDRRGIIGNMSVREAFGLAEELGIECVIPTHWDMFAANQVYREEIELLYEKLAPPFHLQLNPNSLEFDL